MQLLDNSYPEESVQVLEALRYGHLNLLKDLVAHEVGSLVILGDFVSDSNDLLLEVCRNALTLSAYRGPIVIRSHPICPLTSKQLGFLAPHLSKDPLLEVLRRASRVVTTAGSSSAAEAVQLGIPTAIVLDPHTLNYSPFRGSQQVQSVENEHQLAEILSTKPTRGPQFGSMLFVDPALSRWKQEFSKFTTQ
jgi:surface carbohydrate biosynthesis protein (TIGR04326 family)